MGTINYGTSKYITMGAREYSYYDFEHDSCFMEEARAQSEEYGDDIEDIIYAEIASCYECDRDNVEWYLENKYSFDHYSIKIEPGYYEGFYLDILHDPGYYDDEDERKEVYKEIDQVKDFLIDIAGCGIACVYPGWSTKYLDYDGTVAAINQAVEKMRKEAEAMPTYDEYVRREYGIETEKAADTAAA